MKPDWPNTGPGQVQFDSAVTPVSPGGEEAVASASFSQSDTCVLRAYVDEGTFTQSSDVTVVIRELGADCSQ